MFYSNYSRALKLLVDIFIGFLIFAFVNPKIIFAQTCGGGSVIGIPSEVDCGTSPYTGSCAGGGSYWQPECDNDNAAWDQCGDWDGDGDKEWCYEYETGTENPIPPDDVDPGDEQPPNPSCTLNCTNFVNIYLRAANNPNACTPASAYPSSPACTSNTRNIYAHYTNNCATAFIMKVINSYADCSTVDFGNGWVPYYGDRHLYIFDYDGAKKVCVKYRNGAQTAVCGAMINIDTGGGGGQCAIGGYKVMTSTDGVKLDSSGVVPLCRNAENCAPAAGQSVSAPGYGSATTVNPYNIPVPIAPASLFGNLSYVSDVTYYHKGYTLCPDNRHDCHYQGELNFTGIVPQATTSSFTCPGIWPPNYRHLYYHFTPYLNTVNLRGVRGPSVCPATAAEAATAYSALSGIQARIIPQGDVDTGGGVFSIKNYPWTADLATQQKDIGAAAGATWTNVVARGADFNSHTITIPATAGYNQAATCWYKDGLLYGSGNTLSITEDDKTFTGYVVFEPEGPWSQAKDGDIYAHADFVSEIKNSQVLSVNGAGGFPGIPAGNNYNLNGSGGVTLINNGELISSTRWYTEPEQYLDTIITPYYSYFLNMMDVPDPLPTNSLASKPAFTSPLTVLHYQPSSGTLSIDTADWGILANESYIIFVNGNLNINRNVRIANGTNGFIAFIVNGTITIGDNIGYPSGSYVTSAATEGFIEGIYLANNIHTGGASQQRQFVGKGMFIANSITMGGRDLGAGNVTYPANLFIYEPNYLFLMPSQMQNSVVRWEEVAP